jgi:hypothetical protein
MDSMMFYKELVGGLSAPLQLTLNATLNASTGTKAAGTDVTPNAVNWSDTSWSVFDPFGFPPNNSGQIAGITSTIDIRIRDTTTGTFGFPTVRYRISATALASNNYNLNSGSWTALTFTGTVGNRVSNAVTVSNNQYIGFVVSTADTDIVYTFEVQNVSSSNVVLDTFTHLAST